MKRRRWISGALVLVAAAALALLILSLRLGPSGPLAWLVAVPYLLFSYSGSTLRQLNPAASPQALSWARVQIMLAVGGWLAGAFVAAMTALLVGALSGFGHVAAGGNSWTLDWILEWGWGLPIVVVCAWLTWYAAGTIEAILNTKASAMPSDKMAGS